LHPDRKKSQVKGQKVPNKQQVKARVARKNHKVELSLHPDRKKNQEEQERIVQNNQTRNPRVVKKVTKCR
jgi:hypothetical protein